MYLPANDVRKATKGAGLDIDVVCLDLEDAVAANKKEEARTTAVKLLGELDFGRSETAVRINPLMTDLAQADLDALFAKGTTLPGTIVVPKVESREQMMWLFDIVDEYMEERDDFGTINMLGQIESAKGLMNIRDVVEADINLATESMSVRLDGLIFGSDDFAANIGATRTSSATELLYARQSIVVHAKAYGLQAIDIVNINFKDTAALEKECEEGRIMGYTGKQIIHPNQIETVQTAFSPSPERIKYALELEKAFLAHQEAGMGAFTFNDQMIDMPTMLACQSTLHTARIVGLLPPSKAQEQA